MDQSFSQQTLVVIYSGGMDSYTLLHKARASGYGISALSFDYGQRHRKELDYARRVCADLGIKHRVLSLPGLAGLLSGSALTDAIEVPHGHYTAENMKTTVVPNRNMILLSLAVGHAVAIAADAVWYGAHGGDHAIYHDCRPLFVERMNAVCEIANERPMPIIAPYLHQTKIDILREGLAMQLDYAHSWTCYAGREKACGLCGACVERLEAFAALGQVDPLGYEV